MEPGYTGDQCINAQRLNQLHQVFWLVAAGEKRSLMEGCIDCLHLTTIFNNPATAGPASLIIQEPFGPEFRFVGQCFVQKHIL